MVVGAGGRLSHRANLPPTASPVGTENASIALSPSQARGLFVVVGPSLAGRPRRSTLLSRDPDASRRDLLGFGDGNERSQCRPAPRHVYTSPGARPSR